MAELAKLVKLSNGVLMPRVGFGTWQLKGDICAVAVSAALKCGYQLLDSAAAYENEEVVGAELHKFLSEKNESAGKLQFETAAGGNVFVTTKVFKSMMGFENVYKSVMTSLEKFNLKSIDLVLLHWPGSNLDNSSPQNRTVRSQSWKALEKLYKEKYVRAIGVSNYMVNHLNQLLEDGVEFVPMVNQIEIHPLLQPPAELEKWASDHQMVLQAYSSLAIGSSELLQHPTVLKVTDETKKSVGQVLLRWGFQRNYLILPRSSKVERVKSNFDIFDFELSADQMSALNELDQQKHFCWNPYNVT